MAEQRFCKPTVVGSSPIIGSNRRRPFTEITTMYPAKSIHPSITEARAVRAGRGMFYGGVAQGSEHPFDKRGVEGSSPSTTTKGTGAGGETPAARFPRGGSSTVERRSAKSKAAGSSPVPRSTSRGRVPTVIAVGEGLVCGSSSMVERQVSTLMVEGSSPFSRSQNGMCSRMNGTRKNRTPKL